MLKSLSPIDVALIKKIGGNGSSYTLPIATETTLGGVKPVTKTETMTQAVGVDAGGALWTMAGSGGGSEEAGYKDAVNLLDVTLDDTTGGLKYYEYDVSGIEKTDVVIINILFPASYSGVINIKNQSDVKLTDEFPNGGKGIVVVLKAMNGRYLHSAVSSSNTASRVDAPLSLFYGQINGTSGFERPKAQDAITKIKFGLSAAFAPGTRIRIYRW